MIKFIIPVLLFYPVLAWPQEISGKWKSIDDQSLEPRSIIEIGLKGEKWAGRVLKIFPKPGEDQDPVCIECPEKDPRYHQKIIGMEIIQDLEKVGNEFVNGFILDPENGRIYRCKIWMENNLLKVSGYWGPFFRTQTWHRVQ